MKSFQANKVNCSHNKAFTLVELLVVISIIALLLSILMPSLGMARNQAKVMICTANSRQIGLIASLYQTDNDGRVPVVLSRWAPNKRFIEAKHNYLSLALIDYTDSRNKLPERLSPDGQWGDQYLPGGPVETYIREYLPDYFVCPFVRSKKANPNWVDKGTDENGAALRYSDSRIETYTTFLQPLAANSNPYNGMPSNEPDGTPKHGALVWYDNTQLLTGEDPISYFHKLYDKPVRWDKKMMKEVRASGPSSANIIFCSQGEHDNWSEAGYPNGIFNKDSHKKGGRGGTNAVFADGHVEWVEGTRIGWP